MNHIRPGASHIEVEKLCSWLDTFPPEVIKKAIDVAILRNERNTQYIAGILNKWEKKELFTLSLVEGAEKAWNEKKSKEVSGDGSDKRNNTEIDYNKPSRFRNALDKYDDEGNRIK